MAQTLGLVRVIWRGQNVSVKTGGKFENGGMKQNGVVFGQNVDFSNEFVPGKTDATTKMDANTRLSDLWAPGSGELQVQCDTGQSYVGDAFLSNRPNFAADNKGGDVKLMWEHGELAEIVASGAPAATTT
jgi:hypothetical protein